MYSSIDSEKNTQQVGLPPTIFLYTLDQLATLLNITQLTMEVSYIYFDGRSPGKHDRSLIRAVNIAPLDKRPEWRVDQRELVRWMKRKKIIYYDSSVSK